MGVKRKAAVCSTVTILVIAFGLPEFEHSRLSPQGYELLTNTEGCRRQPYQCSAGVWTNGIGHTQNVNPDTRVTDAQIARNLLQDIRIAESHVQRCIRTPLTPGQYDAFVSFAFNVGGGAFCRSTLVKKAQAGDIIGSCKELERWVNADNKPVSGLIKRRRAEAEHCLGQSL